MRCDEFRRKAQLVEIEVAFRDQNTKRIAVSFLRFVEGPVFNCRTQRQVVVDRIVTAKATCEQHTRRVEIIRICTKRRHGVVCLSPCDAGISIEIIGQTCRHIRTDHEAITIRCNRRTVILTLEVIKLRQNTDQNAVCDQVVRTDIEK